ncbi:MAG: hypothetical protein M3475_08055 [Actinomycetota bacterium]|jgi:hypothetical protein|nr:hypothetical protein [Actinomycetota bacterium]
MSINHAAQGRAKIITRRDWDRLQSWHRACPGSEVEHLMHGLFVLAAPTGGAAQYGHLHKSAHEKRGRPSTGDLDDATKGSKHGNRAEVKYTG